MARLPKNELISSAVKSKRCKMVAKEIAFIDQGVDDYLSLLNGVKPDIEIHLLKNSQDGVLQITDILNQRSGIDAIHIISHGNSGYLSLGNSVLSTGTLEKYQSALFSWQMGLKQDGDILLYGCNVGAGTVGKSFVAALAAATSANVAASDTPIGATELGGNWQLGIQTAPIQSSIALTQTTINNYAHIFTVENFNSDPGLGATPSTFTLNGFTYTMSGGDGGGFNYNASTGVGGTGNIVPESTSFNSGTTETLTINYTGNAAFIFNDIAVFFATGGFTYTFTGKLGGSTVATTTSATPTNPGTFQTISFGGAPTVIDQLLITSVDFSPTTESIDDFDYTLNATPTLGGTFTTAGTVNDNATTMPFSGVTVADADGDNVSISITYTAANGTLSGTGITGTAGNYTLTSASAATVQSNLQGLTFTPTANQVAPASTVATTFTLTPNDGIVDGTANATTVITATSINDNPTLTGEPTDVAVTEDVASNVDLSSVSLADVDVTGADFTLVITAGAGTLAAPLGGGVAISNSGTSAITLTGTPANIDTYLNTTSNIKYTSVSNANGNDVTTLTLTVNDQDGSGNLNLGTINVDITAVNDIPTTTNLGGDSFTFTEGDAATILDQSGNATVADVDSTDFNTGNLTVTITSGEDAAEDILSLNTAGTVALAGTTAGSNVSVGGSVVGTLGNNIAAGNDLVVNFSTANATPANVQTLVRSITYQNSDTDAPTTGARNVRTTINDGDGGTSTNADVTVTVASVNDVPTTTNLNTDSFTYTEDDAATVIDQGGNATVSDVDSADFNGGNLTVTITSGEDAAEDTLSLNTAGTVALAGTTAGSNVSVGGTVVGTLGNNIAPGNDLVVNFNANATPANIQTLARAITYQNSDTATPTTGARNVRVTINDGDGGTSTNADVTVTVANANDAPSLANLNGDTVTYLVAGTAVSLDNGANVTLTDVDSTDFNGGNVTAAIVANAQNAEDKLQIGSIGAISTSGSDVIHSDGGGTTIGTFTGGTGGTNLVITLNANATTARTQDLLKALQYTNTDSATTNTAARTVRITVDDGDGGSSTSANQDITVSLQPLPTITSSTYDVSTGQLVITGTDFVAQAGATNDLIANKLTLTGEGGTYTLTDTANVEISSATSATLTLSATDKLNIDGLLNKNGTTSSSATTYNLAGADGWMPQAPADESDLTSNAITVSNVATPTIVSASYDANTHTLSVTGTNLFKKSGADNDIDVSLLTMVGTTSYTLSTTSDVEITSATSFTINVTGSDMTQLYNVFDQLGSTSSNATNYNIQAADGWLTAADSAVDISDNNAESGVTVTIPPKITSSTYNAGTGVLVVTGTNMQANGGGLDIDASTLTLTGEGGATYTLTDTADVNRDSVTQFTVTLSATDKAAVNQIINKDGTTSTSATTYNLAAADDWNTNLTAGDTSDTTSNGITASGVVAPTITSSTYNAATGVLAVTGANFLKKSGVTNDIDASLFTLTGEGVETYQLTDSADVEITSGAAFSITLSATDKAALNQIINKNGTSSTGGTTYNLAAAEDWAAGADAAVNVVDATGNGITASSVAAPTITSSTYHTGTGVLVVTGTGMLKRSGAANDIDASMFTFTGEGGGTYTLIGTSDVDITSDTEFTITLDSTDKAAVNLLLEKAGTTSTDATTYNLAAAEDWAVGADAAVNVVDAAGNGITVTIPAPSGGGGGGSTTTTETVDGTTTSTTTETDGSTTTTITVVDDTRVEDPTTAFSDLADIPIVTNTDGDPILTVSIPTGVGLTVNGQSEALSTQEAINDLINRIEQETDPNSEERQDMTVLGQGFLSSLAPEETLVVQTITPTVSTDQAPDSPIIITGSDSEGDSKQALVIDVTGLPSGTVIQLDNVDFAAIVGAVRVVGGRGQNNVIGDDQKQFIVLGADDDVLFGGGGDDTVGSLGGDDQTYGDAGNDTVYGGTGNDIINGGTGNDQLNGGFGFDIATQTDQLIDYQVKVLGNDVILTHSNGEVDTITDAELIQFASGPSLAISYSDIETAAHHLAKTWLGRDLTAAEGSAVQNWQGGVSDLVSAFRGLPEAADHQNKSEDELLAGLDDNPNIIQLDVARELVAGEGDDQGYLSLGLALNVDGGAGHDVLKMLGGYSDVHLETVDGRIELTRLEDGAMLSIINAEAIAFDSGEAVFIAHNTAEGVLGRLFQSFYDRDATAAEWQSNLKLLADGVGADTILDGLQSQANLSNLSDTDYVQTLYAQTVGRQATAAELDNHLLQLSNGQVDREWLAVEVASSDEAIAVIGNVIVQDGWV